MHILISEIRHGLFLVGISYHLDPRGVDNLAQNISEGTVSASIAT